jgi:Holliday junction DNA helicase RuvB
MHGFLFVDEVHRLDEASEECLYAALEEGVVHVLVREGGRSRALRVRLEPFTLIAATTRPGELSAPFRSRFPLQERLEYYREDELAEVVVRGAARLGAAASGTVASPEAAGEVARRSKGTPREAIRILKRARDIAQVSAVALNDLDHVVHVVHAMAADIHQLHPGQPAARGIELDHVVQAAARLGLDEQGLDPLEQAAVRLLVERGRPVGVEALAARVGVDAETFRRVHEPWLERRGLIERTERGRVATEEARELYGETAPRRMARAKWRRVAPAAHGIPILNVRFRP